MMLGFAGIFRIMAGPSLPGVLMIVKTLGWDRGLTGLDEGFGVAGVVGATEGLSEEAFGFGVAGVAGTIGGLTEGAFDFATAGVELDAGFGLWADCSLGLDMFAGDGDAALVFFTLTVGGLDDDTFSGNSASGSWGSFLIVTEVLPVLLLELLAVTVALFDVVVVELLAPGFSEFAEVA